MMSVFHRGRLHVKSVPLGQVTHLGGVIVSEHDRAGGAGGKFEEVFVIHVVARVKTFPCPLSSCRVGRVQEKRGPLRTEMIADEVKCVPFDKFHAVAAKTDPPDPAGKCFGVPAGRDSSAVFTPLHDAGAGSENSASLDAVAKNCLKSVLHFVAGLAAEILQHARTGEAVVQYPPSKRLSPALPGEKNPPDTGNMRIFFAQQNPFCEVLHGRGKADNRAAAEGFHEQGGLLGQGTHPLAEHRNQPGLASGVAERAALWYAGDVCDSPAEGLRIRKKG